MPVHNEMYNNFLTCLNLLDMQESARRGDRYSKENDSLKNMMEMCKATEPQLSDKINRRLRKFMEKDLKKEPFILSDEKQEIIESRTAVVNKYSRLDVIEALSHLSSSLSLPTSIEDYLERDLPTTDKYSTLLDLCSSNDNAAVEFFEEIKDAVKKDAAYFDERHSQILLNHSRFEQNFTLILSDTVKKIALKRYQTCFPSHNNLSKSCPF
jgi:hypothetical protein